jgi:predicted enzyme related to lactoylglutathione lyase
MGPVLRINSVWLQVQDLCSAADFYQEVFRFSADNGESRRGIIVLSGRPTEGRDFQIVLLQTVPEAPAAVPLQHLSFEVASLEDAQELCARAVGMAGTAIPPRLQSGCWRTVIFDPGGNRLEIVVSKGSQCPVAGRKSEPQPV